MKEPKKEDYGFDQVIFNDQNGWSGSGGEEAYFEALKKYNFQRELKAVYGQIKNLIEDLEGAELSPITNSVAGSRHWYNTMLGNIKHIGEYMEDHELSDEQRKKWGAHVQMLCIELIDNYHKIPFEK